MAANSEHPGIPDPADAAWVSLLGIAGGKGAGASIDGGAVPWLDQAGTGSWRIAPDAPADCRDLFSLYLPLCAGGAHGRWVVAHLGQSLDGCIATRSGDSCFVTGHANIVHLHRMRALCDAVLVGAGTVASDDPRLTTRLVPGPNPIRVVLDPRRRLADGYRVFHDGAAPTLLCVAADQTGPAPGNAELLRVPATADGLRLDALVTTLAARGLRRLFVEGGGVTVSRFLDAGLLSRLQIAVAPLLIGQGRPGLRLPPTERLSDAMRLAPRVYSMGADLFYDVDLSKAGVGEAPRTSDAESPRRLL